MTGFDRLILAFQKLNVDERQVVVTIAERLLAGRRVYRELDIKSDRRDFPEEAGEELLDAVVYLAAAVIQRGRQ